MNIALFSASLKQRNHRPDHDSPFNKMASWLAEDHLHPLYSPNPANKTPQKIAALVRSMNAGFT